MIEIKIGKIKPKGNQSMILMNKDNISFVESS